MERQDYIWIINVESIAFQINARANHYNLIDQLIKLRTKASHKEKNICFDVYDQKNKNLCSDVPDLQRC